VLLLVSTDSLQRLARWLTYRELLEDPRDLVAGYILRVTENLSLNSKQAAAYFLLSHGVIKLVLVLAVLRGYGWGYPAFMAALTILIGYQSYQLALGFSVGLFALTVLDVAVLWLTWHEYRLRRSSR
jgi:uncharacterized membrane protein